MSEFKDLLASRTVWSALVGLLATLLNAFGAGTLIPDQAALVDAILQIVTGASFVAAIFFRKVADKKIA